MFRSFDAKIFRDAKCISANKTRWLIAVMLGLLCGPALAGFDHEWALDEHGVWARSYQTTLEYGVIATEIAGALWLGKDDELGHTFWQSVDSTAISSVTAEALKLAFSRARPDQGNDPHQWFKGRCCDSFPSGEVTLQASFVTPFIVNYGRDYPWAWALEILPAYDAVARLKSQEHWQSDVIAGWAIGSAIGYLTTTWKTPLMVQILPGGLSVGFKHRF
jgi:membrane-associated phospholipid phosphatase